MSKNIAASHVRLKRAYDAPSPDDGVRILVDRLWPRGLTKEAAAIDQWPKELSPSTELRKRFAHEPTQWPEFCRRYAEELSQVPDALHGLRELARKQRVTLVYGARDETFNNAVALRDVLLGGSSEPKKSTHS